MRKLRTLSLVLAATAPSDVWAQAIFQSVVVVDTDRKVSTETGCIDGVQVSTLEVLPDRIRKTAPTGKFLDIFIAIPGEPGRPTPLRPLTVPSAVPSVDVTYTGQLTADGITDIKTANNRSLCAWRLKIL